MFTTGRPNSNTGVYPDPDPGHDAVYANQQAGPSHVGHGLYSPGAEQCYPMGTAPRPSSILVPVQMVPMPSNLSGTSRRTNKSSKKGRHRKKKAMKNTLFPIVPIDRAWIDPEVGVKRPKPAPYVFTLYRWVGARKTGPNWPYVVSISLALFLGLGLIALIVYDVAFNSNDEVVIVVGSGGSGSGGAGGAGGAGGETETDVILSRVTQSIGRFKGTIEDRNRTYSAELSDPDSDEYAAMEESVCNTWRVVYSDYQVHTCNIHRFWSGSLWYILRMVVTSTDIGNVPLMVPNMAEILETVGEDSLDAYNITIARTSFTVLSNMQGQQFRPCDEKTCEQVCLAINTTSYECDCFPGFTLVEGTQCNETDECASSPCQNGGTCQDKMGRFQCTCEAGFEGSMCETDTDECTSSPCQNGGTCTDAVDGYNCTCDDGYEGDHCQTEIDECASSPCVNGANCTDLVNGYNCTCDAGYEGVNCETDIDECASDPCQNNATCADFVNGYNCSCPAGYEGSHCETDTDECASDPCMNDATCQDAVDGYSCDCADGYEGVHCETDTDECASDPCLNDATCVDAENSYNCTCTANFVGTHCETDNSL